MLYQLFYVTITMVNNMSHLCRDLFPSILETKGLLYHLLTTHFNPSKSLYYDLKEEEKFQTFKDYIYSFLEEESDKKK